MNMATIPSPTRLRGADAEIEYPTGDGRPMGETPLHRDNLITAVRTLERYFADQPLAYVSGNMFVYYEKGNRHKHVSPDVFVALGVPKDTPRDAYYIWEKGHGLDFVVELTSKSTQGEDLDDKMSIYQDEMPVPEYFLFDPKDEYLDPPLQGHRLREGKYVPIEMVDDRLPSEALGLHHERDGEWLRFYNPVTGGWLLLVRASVGWTSRQIRVKGETQRNESELFFQPHAWVAGQQRPRLTARIGEKSGLPGGGLEHRADAAAALAQPLPKLLGEAAIFQQNHVADARLLHANQNRLRRNRHRSGPIRSGPLRAVRLWLAKLLGTSSRRWVVQIPACRGFPRQRCLLARGGDARLHAREQLEQFVGRQRLDMAFVEAGFDRLLAMLRVAISRQRDQRRNCILRPQTHAPRHGQPVDLGHGQIDQHQVGLDERRLLDGRYAVIGDMHFMAPMLQQQPHILGGVTVVVDYKNAHRRGGGHSLLPRVAVPAKICGSRTMRTVRSNQ